MLRSSYPPNPPGVPAELTEMTWPYFLRMLLVMVCLILFVTVYFGLVAGSAYFSYASFVSMRDNDPTFRSYEERQRHGSRGRSAPRQPVNPALAIGGSIASALVCLFLLKGFFKFRKPQRNLEIEITAKGQPEFFDFLRQLCKDAGAPMPYRVFLSPEVNACVVYDNSLLSLIVPTSKNLTVGLGLVNGLNLTEFKAVLAHEFGHFAQGSMLFGSYVYKANHIIADMVYGRDFFDDWLERAQVSRDRWLSFFAVMFAGVIWVLRKALEGIFYAINFANSSLSRQMEFNADLVAVTLTGSDAIVHALRRLDFAGQALEQAVRHLSDARDHKLYTRDLFYHQTRSAAFLQERHRDDQWGEVPPLPDDPTKSNRIFKPGDDGIPPMWATHPSNFDREENAKRRYVRGVIDERSPWLLFKDAGQLRQGLTSLFYLRAHHVSAEKLCDPENVQNFIDRENAETSYSPRYHGMYDGRLLDLTGWEMWVHVGMELRDPKVLRELHGQLYGPWLQALLESDKLLGEEQQALERARDKEMPLTFRGRTYTATDVPRLLEQVEAERKKIEDRVGAQDRIVFQVHYAMIEQLGDGRADEFLERYRFHEGAQGILGKLSEAQAAIQVMLAALSGQRQLSEEQFRETIKFFQDVHLTLRGALDEAARLSMPPLQNMREGQPLSEALLSEPLLSPLSDNATTLQGTWTDRLCQQLGGVLDRLRRVHAKSLGRILTVHDRIATAWLALWGQPANDPLPHDLCDSLQE